MPATDSAFEEFEGNPDVLATLEIGVAGYINTA